MSWRDRLNASQCSARYAERKRAAQRARDEAQSLKPQPCRYCGVALDPKSMVIYCDEHGREFVRLGTYEGISAATKWVEGGPYMRALRGES